MTIWNPAWPREMADRLRAARGRRPLREVGRESGVDASQFARIEAGRSLPGLHAFRGLAIALQVSADELLGLARCPHCRRIVERDQVDSHCPARAWAPGDVVRLSMGLDIDEDSTLWTVAHVGVCREADADECGGGCFARIESAIVALGLPPAWDRRDGVVYPRPDFRSSAAAARGSILTQLEA